MKYKIEWDLGELKVRIKDLGKKELKVKCLVALAEYCAAAMRREAPVATGRLRNSIIVQKINELVYVVGPTAQYSPYVEYGTRPHIIVPRRAKALRFKTKEGVVVFAKRVRHPGTKPNPFVHRAAEDTIRNADRIIRRVIEE